MTSAEVVARARSAIGRGTIYFLGAGGRHPESDKPSDDLGRCDCSGYTAWVLRLDRKQPSRWLSTDGILAEARHGGMFTLVQTPAPGDLVVYGDHNGKQGHVGVVTNVWAPPWGLAVCHCSSGNYRRTGDAIQETGAGAFQAAGALFARCTRIEGAAAVCS